MKDTVVFEVPCMGEVHQIIIEKGRLGFSAHTVDDLKLLKKLGEPCGCLMAPGWLVLHEPRDPGTGRPVVVGRTERSKPPVGLGRSDRGRLAGRRVIDALVNASGPLPTNPRVGPWIFRVLLTGEIVEGGPLTAASERTPVWGQEASALLHEFALRCAERVLSRERAAGREPDSRSWAALETKRRWLRGEATDRELDSAARAAHDAAWDDSGWVVWSILRTAVLEVAWSAADPYALAAAADVVRAVDRYASGLMASGASQDAVRALSDAEKEWQERELLRMLREAGAPVLELDASAE